jgi:hypothetical protein
LVGTKTLALSLADQVVRHCHHCLNTHIQTGTVVTMAPVTACVMCWRQHSDRWVGHCSPPYCSVSAPSNADVQNNCVAASASACTPYALPSLPCRSVCTPCCLASSPLLLIAAPARQNAVCVGAITDCSCAVDVCCDMRSTTSFPPSLPHCPSLPLSLPHNPYVGCCNTYTLFPAVHPASLCLCLPPFPYLLPPPTPFPCLPPP